MWSKTAHRLKQVYLSLLFLLVFVYNGLAQPIDTIRMLPDSTRSVLIPGSATALQKLLEENSFLNSKAQPVEVLQRLKTRENETAIFYLLAGLLFLFGIIKTVYGRYFSTLFRVFFNTSLRQSQLTDQLIQAKLPSLFFNLIFVLAGGMYAYLLLQRITNGDPSIHWFLLLGCVLALIVIYVVKFFAVKFIGWITGYNAEADTYIFIVFLINKIIGVCLLPIVVILAFSDVFLTNIVLVFSMVCIGIMLLFRYVRSFGLLQHKLKISRFHFLLYIFSLEVLPLILIYKVVELFITKKL